MKDILFLDCTLRDGAHVVSGEFKRSRIINVVRKLTESKTDIIEIGFLKEGNESLDKIFYPKIENAYRILDEAGITDSNNCSMYALMARADDYDISKLSPANGKIKLIRVAFYYDYLDGGIEFVKKAMDIGYLCSINLINTPGATADELKHFIERVNEVVPFAVSIVDTFGVLTVEELESILCLYDKEMDSGIRIGLHVHENLSLAFAMAQFFLKNTKEERRVIIDGSLMGIGRAPGNLCTELITNHLNKCYQKEYDIGPILSAIDKEIKPLKNDFRWGYSPEFTISAKYRVHRSYAEFLETNGVSLEDIELLLANIDAKHAEKYNKEYITNLAKERKLL
jgi:4-hydroxy 2-oxovalerate aldolase